MGGRYPEPHHSTLVGLRGGFSGRAKPEHTFPEILVSRDRLCRCGKCETDKLGEEFQFLETGMFLDDRTPSLRPVHGFCSDVIVCRKGRIGRVTNLERYCHLLDPVFA